MLTQSQIQTDMNTPVANTPPIVTGETPAAGATSVGITTAVTATFTEPVQASTVSFALKNSAGISIPASLSYNASTNTDTLTPSAALAYGTTYTATVSGATNSAGVAMTAPLTWSFTTVPVITNASIWGSTVPSGTSTSNAVNGIELGVKFSSSVSGYITGIRFYKGTAANSGTHIGHLWTSSGSLLATVTFTNESSSGWQQANFSSPVAITAGTTYIASYYSPTGHFSYTAYALASSGVRNGVLQALSNSAADGNGVFLPKSGGGFPTDTNQATNLWVDVVFSDTLTTTPPAVTTETPATGADGRARVVTGDRDVQRTDPVQHDRLHAQELRGQCGGGDARL